MRNGPERTAQSASGSWSADRLSCFSSGSGAGDSLIANPKPVTTLGLDGWLTVPVPFTPVKGKTYYIEVTANAFNGDTVSRLLTLVAK